MQRTLPFLVPIAYLAMLVINALAGTGAINNTSPADISNRYPTAVTPAGYAFSIWSVIYLGLAVFAVWQVLPAQRNDARGSPLRRWFLASCAANISWLFSWHYDLIPLSFILMLILLASLVMINQSISDLSRERWSRLILNVPFGLYLGWIVIATSLNLLIMTAALDLGLADSASLGAVLIASVACVGVWLRITLRRSALALAMAWGFVAIAVRHQAIMTVAAVALMAALVLVIAAVPWPALRPNNAT